MAKKMKTQESVRFNDALDRVPVREHKMVPLEQVKKMLNDKENSRTLPNKGL